MNHISKSKTQSSHLTASAFALMASCGAFAADQGTDPTNTPRVDTTSTTPVVTSGPSFPQPESSRMEPSREINVPRPDLVPLTFEFWRNPNNDEDDYGIFGDAANFMASVYVGNFGKADATWFYGYFKFKVLETTDPVNWGVGKTAYCGAASFLGGIKVMDIAYGQYCFGEGFLIPKVVTKAEVVFIADPYFKYLGGTPEHGAIIEMDEKNNVSAPVIVELGEE
jgi:hypothetical protein